VGHVTFHVSERAARVALWLNQNFLTGEEQEASEAGELKVAFASLRQPGKELRLSVGADGSCQLFCDDMELCGDVVQSLAEYLGLEDLSSECDFPNELNKLEQLLGRADELQSVRY
jgi:Bardet-Biedl syndrome 2 protein